MNSHAENNEKLALSNSGYFEILLDKNFSITEDLKKIKFDEATRTNAFLSLTLTDETMFLANPDHIHFHSPSEHTIDGVHMDLEVHFAHTLTGDTS